MPGENHTFTTHVDPVSPPSGPVVPGTWPVGGFGGGAGHCPRVRYAYFV